MISDRATESLLPESARSRVLQSAAERERLERTLLMLPNALDDYTPLHAAEVFAQAACEIAGARLVLIALPESLRSPVLRGPDAVRLDGALDPASVPALAPAFDGQVVYLEDALDQLPPNQLSRTTDGRDLRSLAALPVRGRGARTLGVLCLGHHRSHAVSERQIALGAALAVHLGHTIEVTDAVAEQTRISLALQQSLLPPLLPSIPGLDIAARYRPSGEGNAVGGDFYDVFPTGAGCWSVLLGDASGIGPEAAGLAGVARYTARALAESASPPAEILRQLNLAVLRAAADGRFCSAVLASITVTGDSADVALASAGHPSAYLQRGTHVEAVTGGTGTILGLSEDAVVTERQLRLGPGDAMVLYTDGVVEARGATGELFGDDRLARVLASASGRSAEGIARRVEREVLDHRGPRSDDDVAIVVARVPPRGLATDR